MGGWGRRGLTSAFFEAQSNAGKTPQAAVWRVGGGRAGFREFKLQVLCGPEKPAPREDSRGPLGVWGWMRSEQAFHLSTTTGAGGLLRADFQKEKLNFFINSSLRESSTKRALHGASLAPIRHPRTPGCIPCDN